MATADLFVVTLSQRMCNNSYIIKISQQKLKKGTKYYSIPDSRYKCFIEYIDTEKRDNGNYCFSTMEKAVDFIRRNGFTSDYDCIEY